MLQGRAHDTTQKLCLLNVLSALETTASLQLHLWQCHGGVERSRAS